VAFLPAEKGVDLLRYVKDEEERTRIAKAADIADRAFAALLPKVVPGTTERDLARDLAYEMELLGAEGKAFDIIVASGENGSMPHAIPGRRLLERGDFVTFDFGALYDGYRSDMTAHGRSRESHTASKRTVQPRPGGPNKPESQPSKPACPDGRSMQPPEA
jgi:Xaa-Pro aminopeptidase